MTPAFTISWLNLPMAVSNSVLGMTPASLFLSAFTIPMNRITMLRLAFHFGRAGRFLPPEFRLYGYDERVFATPTCPTELFRRSLRAPGVALITIARPLIVDGLIGRGPEIHHHARRLRRIHHPPGNQNFGKILFCIGIP